MIDQIVDLIKKESEKTPGQDAAARLHSVLMDVGSAVGRIIVAEQQQERLTNPDDRFRDSDTCTAGG